MVNNTSRFTFISHDENSKERKHRLYSHSRNAAIRNKRRLGREALRPARPLPVKSLTLRPPITTTSSSTASASTSTRPSPTEDFPASVIPSVVIASDAETGIHSGVDLLWGQTHTITPTQPADHDPYTDTELCETYPGYLPALDPDSYAMMLYDTSLGAFEEPVTRSSSLPERQRFMADYDMQQSWLQMEHVHSTDSLPDFTRYNIAPETISSVSPGNRSESIQMLHQNLFFGLDLEDEHLNDHNAIIAAFEQQSVPIDQYNADLMHTTSNDTNIVTRTTSQHSDQN